MNSTLNDGTWARYTRGLLVGAVTTAAAWLTPLGASLAAAPSPALEAVAIFNGAMPTGVTVAEGGRIFVNFPRWGDDVPFTVGELRDGQVRAYPDAAVNKPDNSRPGDTFLSVQSVVADGQGRVWVLDTGAPNFSNPAPGGAKLVAIDLKTDQIAKTIVFPPDVMLDRTYVNDMRFDLRIGRSGVAYITDSSLSGTGGLIVVDLDTGKAVRRLTGHPSTSADPSFRPVVEGKPMQARDASGNISPFTVASDGIALSPDGKTLYYSPLSSRHLYSVPTAMLRDPTLTDAQIGKAVSDLGEKGASDGLESDANGTVYASDYENNAIRTLGTSGTWKTLVQDDRLLWPDTLSVGPDGYLYVTANQLHRQAGFQGGKDMRVKPYVLYRLHIGVKPAPTR
ncbi:L-dopachrome tautomerase-related protein [Cupriavidus pauculus]|uniref:Gluconolaconase n=1 Tax=Cupriavidus pauculus TaxID=82633 RepID=A0A3G8HCN3_9BURK|nr:gluconolaconase [Cupriavidus pauculus]